MFVRDLSFRSLLARPLFVKYDASRLFDHDRLERLCWPEGADSVLCYVYYDRQAGLNLDVLAPTRFEDGAIFHEAAPMRVAEVRMMLRPDVYGDCEAKFLSKHDEDRVLERYAEQCDISDGYWKNDPNLVALLGLEEIDHLRHPSYPLDVQVALMGDDDSVELVWMRLVGVAESGHLVAELLNNPFGKHGCASGDLMALGVTEDDEGTLRLFTHDAMAVEPRD